MVDSESTVSILGILAGAGWEKSHPIGAEGCLFCPGRSVRPVFYLQKGRARVTVVSEPQGGDHRADLPVNFWEKGAGGRPGPATVLGYRDDRLHRTEDQARRDDPVMHEEHSFSELFLKFLLERSMRIQADLVDQLFNSSEKRLARILLLMAEFGQPGEPEQYIPKISQQTLAEMIGTTRSGKLLHESLSQARLHRIQRAHQGSQVPLNVVLHDQFSEPKAAACWRGRFIHDRGARQPHDLSVA